jgi:hypothetical protein
MATERARDLHAFKSFVDQQLSDEPVPTVSEVIARWSHEIQNAEQRAVIDELRKKFGLTSDALTLQRNPQEWVKRLRALVASQPIRTNNMDDSRESIYAGRGE